MIIYWIIFCLLMISCLNETRKVVQIKADRVNVLLRTHNLSCYRILVLCFVIILLAGIRWHVGTDWQAFLDDFEYFKSSSWDGVKHSIYGLTYERGYVITAYFFAKYIGDYSIYLTFQSIFITICVFPVIYKYSEYPILSFLGFFAYSFCYAFAVARSGFAMAICFRAFDALLSNKKIKFFLLVVLATLFHNTAIIFFILYFLDKIKLSTFWVIVLGITSFFLSYFSETILIKIASLAGIPESYAVRINTYFAEDVDYGAVSGIFRIITRGFVLVIMFLHLWNKRQIRKNNLIVNMYLFCTFIYVAVSKISVVFMRLCYYFEDISQFLIFAGCIATYKDKNNRFLLKLIIIIFFIGKMASRLLGESYVVPYRTIL